MYQLHLYKQVKSLFFCYLDQLTIQPTQESCLITLANKQYSDTTHLCQFTIYKLKSDQYLLNWANHQSQVYECIRNNWSGLSITAGISLLILSNECDLILTQHQISYMAYHQYVPVIKILDISSVPNQPRKFFTKTQTIIKLVAFCILIFLSIIVSVCAIIKHVNHPRLILTPL